VINSLFISTCIDWTVSVPVKPFEGYKQEVLSSNQLDLQSTNLSRFVII